MARRLLIERTIGEIRAVTFDEDNRPSNLFLSRTGDERLCYGDTKLAVVRKMAGSTGSIFLETEAGQKAAMRPQKDIPLHEGQRVTIKIACEAFGDKLPRAVLVSGEHHTKSPIDRWIETQGNLPLVEVKPNNEEISEAFEHALSPTVQIPGGGALTFSFTRALTAIDIDSAGRRDKGRPASRALNLNKVASEELARQIELRQLGGLFVLDCVAPLNKDAAQKVRNAFTIALERISSRLFKALAPSALGLMEASVERRYTPLRERLLNTHGNPTPQSTALEGLRHLERAAIVQPMANLVLSLPKGACVWLKSAPMNFQEAIDAKYGARISIEGHDGSTIEVKQK